MRLLRLLPIALSLVAPATLPAFAAASPPDPTWIHGLYDDADFDDVVVLVLSAAAGGMPTGVAVGQPVDLLIGWLSDREERTPLAPSALTARPRAPPYP